MPEGIREVPGAVLDRAWAKAEGGRKEGPHPEWTLERPVGWGRGGGLSAEQRRQGQHTQRAPAGPRLWPSAKLHEKAVGGEASSPWSQEPLGSDPSSATHQLDTWTS